MVKMEDIRSLTDFTRNARDYVQRLKETRSPVVLTINGKAALVVQDAESFQEMRERLEQLEQSAAVAAIRQGIAEFERGEDMDAREALEALRAKHGIRA